MSVYVSKTIHIEQFILNRVHVYGSDCACHNKFQKCFECAAINHEWVPVKAIKNLVKS